MFDETMTIEDAATVCSTPSAYPEIQEYKIKCMHGAKKLEHILKAEDGGSIDPEEADDQIVNLVQDCADQTLEIFEIGMEPGDVEGEFSQQNNNMAYFSQGVSATLAGMIADEYATEEDGIVGIMEATSSDRDTVVGILNGDYVPDPTFGENIVGAFDTLQTDPAIHGEWNNLILNSYNQAIAANEEYAEEQGLQNAGEVIEEIEIEPDYEQEAQIANLAANQNVIMAKFAQIDGEKDLSDKLTVLNRQAEYLVTEGAISPMEKKDLLGNFSTNQERVAFFSQACNKMNQPITQQLSNIKFYLDMRQKHPGNLGNFGQLTDTDEALYVPDLTEKEAKEVDEFVAATVFAGTDV